MTLRDHVAERVEEARKFGEYVAEQMKGIGFRIEYTMNGKRKSPVYSGQRSTTYPDVQIEQRDRRVKAKRETIMSIDNVHALLRSHQSYAKGDGGWHDNTKQSKLKYAKDYAGKIEGHKNYLGHDVFTADTLVLFPWNLYEEMNEIIRKLAVDILNGDVKMHFPEYQTVVNAYTIAFYEGAGIREEGAFDAWMELPDRIADRWATDKTTMVSSKRKTEHERGNTISEFRWRRRFNGPPGDAPVQGRSRRNLGDHPRRT